MKTEKEILDRIRETSYENVMTALGQIDELMNPKPEPESPPMPQPPEGMCVIEIIPKRKFSWDEIRSKLWNKHEELRLLTWVLDE